MDKVCFVGFDTSNYTTSASACDMEGRVFANLKAPLPVSSGERGIRQSDAVFAHVKNMPKLCDELREAIRGYRVLGVGVSSRPRSVEGSYMPCFLVGVAAAKAFAAAIDAPLFEFSHQDGHVMSAIYSSGAEDKLICRDFLSFHVSGGTTEMMLTRPLENSFSLDLIGCTADINAGQLIDRVGVGMGLDFPCGAALERLAAEFSGKEKKLRVVVKEKDTQIACNLSGIENIAMKMFSESGDKSEVAAYVFANVRDTLSEMARLALLKYGEMPVLFAGGVMSNKLMRKALGEKFEAYFAEPAFSADNAAGIALLCRKNLI